MKKISFIALLLSLTVAFTNCTPSNNPQPNNVPPEDQEYIQWKRNGVDYSSTPASIKKVYDITGSSKKYTFQEKTAMLNCDNLNNVGDFVLNTEYSSNTSNVVLTYQLGYAGNSNVDTTFHYVTFKVTQNDATWFAGEFAASDCKATDAAGIVTDIPVVLTEGKFKLRK